MNISAEKLNQFLMEDYITILQKDRIYHYSGFETGVDSIVLEGTLKFSNPIYFNDPFDCSEKLLNVKINKENTTRILKQELSLTRRETRNISINEVKRFQNSIMKEKREEFKICCFSGKSDNLLMWSHYANKHNGICCGFDFPINIPNKFLIKPVRYEPNVNQLEGENDLYKIILYWLTTKSKLWEYENEIRAIARSRRQSSSFEIINYDRKYLREIIFGCNITKNEIDKTIRKFKANGLPLKDMQLKRAHLDTETFNVKIQDL